MIEYTVFLQYFFCIQPHLITEQNRVLSITDVNTVIPSWLDEQYRRGIFAMPDLWRIILSVARLVPTLLSSVNYTESELDWQFRGNFLFGVEGKSFDCSGTIASYTSRWEIRQNVFECSGKIYQTNTWQLTISCQMSIHGTLNTNTSRDQITYSATSLSNAIKLNYYLYDSKRIIQQIRS